MSIREDIRLQVEKCHPQQGDLLVVHVGVPLKSWQRQQVAQAVKSQLAEGSGVSVLVVDTGIHATLVQARDWRVQHDKDGAPEAVDIGWPQTTRVALDQGIVIEGTEQLISPISESPLPSGELRAKLTEEQKDALKDAILRQCAPLMQDKIENVPATESANNQEILAAYCGRAIYDRTANDEDRREALVRQTQVRYGIVPPGMAIGTIPSPKSLILTNERMLVYDGCCLDCGLRIQGTMFFALDEFPTQEQQQEHFRESHAAPMPTCAAARVEYRVPEWAKGPEKGPPITEEIARQPVIDVSCLETAAESWRDREPLL